MEIGRPTATRIQLVSTGSIPRFLLAARARPGATIVLHSRNASDFDLDLDPEALPDPRDGDVVRLNSGVTTPF